MKNKEPEMKKGQANDSAFSLDRRDVVVQLLLSLAIIVGLALAAIFQILWLLAIVLVALIALLVFSAKIYKKYKQKFGQAYTKGVKRNALIIVPVYFVTYILTKVIWSAIQG